MFYGKLIRPAQPPLVTEFEEQARKDCLALLVGTLLLAGKRLEVTGDPEDVFTQITLVGWRITGRLHRGRGYKILDVVYFSSLLGQIVQEKPTRSIIHDASLISDDHALCWTRYELVTQGRCSVDEAMQLQGVMSVRDRTEPDSPVTGWTVCTVAGTFQKQEYFTSRAGLVTRKT